MQRFGIRGILATMAFAVVLVSTVALADEQSSRPGSRTFQFNYGATLNELPIGARVRIWFPVPQSSKHQQVSLSKQDLPTKGQTNIEPQYGNKITYFEVKRTSSNNLSFASSYLIRRQEVRGLDSTDGKVKLTDQQRQQFLSANAKVPLAGKQLHLLDGLSLSGDSLSIARQLYEQVDRHVRYDKSQPGYGNGDVLWVCDSRFGNCTDFHSLFISLSRATGLPARFEIGFPLPPKRGEAPIGGYHCWASFYTDQWGWVPVDISEADKHPEQKDYYFGNLTEDRVSLTTGRDIALVPRQDGERLNYFVYPYVEVDGKPWPNDRINLAFSYADVEEEIAIEQ